MCPFGATAIKAGGDELTRTRAAKLARQAKGRPKAAPATMWSNGLLTLLPQADHHALLRETLTVARMPHIGPDRVSLSAIEQTGQLDQFKLAGISSG